MVKDKIPLSPFSERRREMELPQTTLFVNYDDYKEWISLSNCVIEGTRGTGKTSILSVLNYSNQWLEGTQIRPSKNLQQYFGDIPSFLGLYMRCETIERSLWNRWRCRFEGKECLSSQLLFASFVNYYFLDGLLKAIVEIQEAKPKLFFGRVDTFDLITRISEIVFPDENTRPSTYDYSINSLRSVMNTTLHSLRQQVYSLIDLPEISSRFVLHSATSGILSEVAQVIQNTYKALNTPYFLILIDDVDRLDPWQIEVLNSFISSSSSPVSFKLTCTGEYRNKRTTNNRSLSTTDLLVSKLNNEDDPRYKKDEKSISDLFQGIFNLRLESAGIKEGVPLTDVFGPSISIENVFLDTLETSISPAVRAIIQDFKDNPFYEKLSDYWIDLNKFDPRYSRTQIKDKKEADLVNHIYYNKYRVSAVFSAIIKFELDESFTYYSFEVIKMISSGSLRHFLRICDKLWSSIYEKIEVRKQLTPLEMNRQSAAIRESAYDVYNNIESDQFNKEVLTTCKKMCDRLGTLMRLFLSTESVSKTPECLSLSIDHSKLDSTDHNRLWEIIDRLKMYEAIKVQSENDREIKIALSTMLAPVFCLPYRSPFSYSYKMPDPRLLLRLLTSTDKIASSIIQSIYNDRIGKEQTRNLFQE